MRGRKKSLQLHQAEGTYRTDEHPGRRPAPAAKMFDVSAPVELNGRAADIWHDIVASVGEGHFAASDRLALTRYCLLHTQLLDAHGEVELNGLYEASNHGTKLTAAAKHCESLARTLNGLAKSLGLTSLDRSRIEVPSASDSFAAAGLVGPRVRR
jgi:P27 family predicted phage terminase small subunit